MLVDKIQILFGSMRWRTILLKVELLNEAFLICPGIAFCKILLLTAIDSQVVIDEYRTNDFF